MKPTPFKNIVFFILLQFIAVNLYSQAPPLINYQAMARDAAGAPIVSQPIALKFEIKQGTSSLFTETQNVTTNALGLFSTQIGKNTAGGVNGVNWQAGSLLLEVSIDITGGTSFTSMGQQQLVSVPYAMHVPSTYTNNVLTIGSNSFTLSPSGTSSPQATITMSGIGTVSSTGTNTFDINIPATTLTGAGSATVTGAFPNFTVTTPDPLTTHAYTVTGSGAAVVSSAGTNTFDVSVPATSVAVTTLAGTASVTSLGTNSVSINIPPATASNASFVTSGAVSTTTLGANSFSINVPTSTLNVTTAAGTTSVSSLGTNSLSINIPASSVAVTSVAGTASVTNIGTNSVSINIPPASSTPSTSVGITTAPGSASVSYPGTNSVSINVPASAVAITTLAGTASVTTVGTNSVSINIPASSVAVTSVAGSASVTNIGTNSVSINIPPATASNASFVTSGAVGTTTLGANSFSINVPTSSVALTTQPGTTSLTVLGTNSVSINIPPSSASNASFVTSGAVNTATLGANSFSINVPTSTLNVTSVAGSMSVTSPGTNTLSLNIPASSVAVTSVAGSASVTNIGTNSVSINIPPSSASNASFVTSGAVNTATLGANSFSINVPTSSVALTTQPGTTSLTVLGTNSVSINIPPSSASNASFVTSGAVNTTTLGANSFSINVPTSTLNVTSVAGSMSVTSPGTNTLSINIPASSVAVTSVAGSASVTNIGTNSVSINIPPSSASNASFVTSGAVNTATLGANSFSINVPTSSVAITTIGGSASVTTLGTNSVSINVPAASVAVTSVAGSASVTNIGTNSVSINIPPSSASNASFVTSGAVNTATLGANSFSINVPTSTLNVTSVAGSMSVTSPGTNTLSINIPASSVAVTSVAGSASVTNIGTNSVSINIPPSSASNASFVTSGAVNTATLGANSFSIDVPTSSVALTTLPGTTSLTVLGTNSVSINIPPSSASNASFVTSGAVNTATLGANSFSINVPTSSVAITTIGGSASVTTLGTNSVSINVPASSVAVTSVAGTASVTNIGTNSVSINIPPSTASNASFVTSGAVSTATLGANSFSINVPTGTLNVTTAAGTTSVSSLGTNSLSINIPASSVAVTSVAGSASVTNIGTNSVSINIPPSSASNASFVTSGAVTISTLSANSFSVDVPTPVYNSNTGDLLFGSSTTNILPALTLSGGILTSGPASNSVNISSGGSWSTSGNTGITGADFLGTTDAANLVFKTNNTQAMIIDASGNIGIGAVPVSALLTVDNHSLTGRMAVYVKNAMDQIGAAMPLTIETTTVGQVFGSDTYGRMIRMGNADAGNLSSYFDMGIDQNNSFFLSRLNVYNPNADFAISSAGNVGIGLSSPTQRLDVDGAVQFSKALMPNGNAGTSGQVLQSAGAGAPPVWVSSTGGGWGLTGNSGINSFTNFLGTTDANDLVLKSNNTEGIRINKVGKVGVNGLDADSRFNVSESSSAIPAFATRSSMNYTGAGSGGHVSSGYFSNTFNGSGGPQVFSGVSGQVSLNSGNNSSQWATGGWFDVVVGGGSHSSVQAVTGFVESYGGSVTNAYAGFFDFYSGSVPAAKAYGVYIGNVVGTSKWSLFASDATAPSYFAGDVQLGGALVPAGSAGTAGQFLQSSGPGVAPVWANVSGGISGGTSNYVTKYSSATTLVKSILYDNGSSIGINTSSPNGDLHISSSNPYGIIRLSSTSTSAGFVTYIDNSGTALLNYENSPMYFGTNGANRMMIDAIGNIGMGNITPTEKLDVTGNVKFSGALMPNNTAGTAGQVLTSAGAGAAPTWTTISGATPTITGVGITTVTSSGSSFSVNTPAASYNTANGNLIQGSSTVNITPALTYNNGIVTAGPSTNSLDITGIGGWVQNSATVTLAVPASSVGIGVNPPTQKLDVAGNIKLSGALMPAGSAGTAGQVLQSNGAGAAPTWVTGGGWSLNGNSGTTASNAIGTTDNVALNFIVGNSRAGRLEYNNSTYFGHGSGPFSLGSSSYNVGIGTNALNGNTTGSFNSSLGYYALISMSTGSENTSIGNQSLLNNISGNRNLAAGSKALYSNLGSDNVSLGSYGLFSSANNSSNTAVGSYAGYSNVSGNSNVFIGNRAGYNELGSNKLYIANNSSSTLIYGDFSTNRVGINNTLPTEALDVTGNLRFSGALMPNNAAGTAGQILQSSGAGFAPVWAAAPTSTFAYSQTTGSLTSGTFSAFTTPTLTLNGSTLTSGPSTNSVNLNAFVSPWVQTGGTVAIAASSVNVAIGSSTAGALLSLNNNSVSTRNGLALINGRDASGAGIPVLFDVTTTGQAFGSATFGRIVRYSNSTFGSTFDMGIDQNSAMFLTRTGTYNPSADFVIGSSGLVGLGKSVPTEKLDVVGNVRFSGALMPNNASGTSGQILQSNGAGAAPTWINNISPGWGTTGTAGTTAGTNFLGTTDAQDVVFKSNNTEVFRAQSAGVIRMLSGSDRTITMQGQTSNIDANNLMLRGSDAGIGGQARYGGAVILQGGDGYNQSNTIYFGGSVVIRPGKNQYGSATYNAGSVIFQNANSGNAYYEMARFSGDGNLGLGTTTPTEKLEVVGNIEIPAANDYKYASAKTNYATISPASFTSINGILVGGNSTGNARWLASGSSAISDALYATLQLPNGATVTAIDAYVYDNDGTNDVSVTLNAINMTVNILNPVGTTNSTSGASNTPVTVSNTGLFSTIDNVNNSYYLTFNTRQNSPALWIRGVRITYLTNKAN